MPVCSHCETDYEVDDLVRHDRRGVLLVHCPSCECLLGRYRRHGDRPAVDRLRDA
jgi:NAD-dependent SIR2 family protein deacetylase